MTQIILASSSPYRRELLDRLGLAYEAISPDVCEDSPAEEPPRETARRLAELKARAIAALHPGAIVIGSDQVADLGGEKLGKPHTRENAVRQLLAMQAKETVFWTAVCVIDAAGSAHAAEVPTRVRMRRLSQETIEAYIDREQPFDCAGSAKIECLGIALMEKVSSDDPTALIGLPLMKLTSLLAEAGAEVLPGLALKNL